MIALMSAIGTIIEQHKGLEYYMKVRIYALSELGAESRCAACRPESCSCQAPAMLTCTKQHAQRMQCWLCHEERRFLLHVSPKHMPS